MTTIRVSQRKRFTVVERGAVNDRRLSFRARGVLFWLLDKPDDWQTDSNAIARATEQPRGEGRDAIRTALKELEDCGYLAREKKQIEGGKWVTEVFVHERPTPENPSSVAGNRGLETRLSVDQALSTEDCLPKTDGSSEDSFSNDNDKAPDEKCIRCHGGGTIPSGARCPCTWIIDPNLLLVGGALEEVQA